jgi:hypothetical protein
LPQPRAWLVEGFNSVVGTKKQYLTDEYRIQVELDASIFRLRQEDGRVFNKPRSSS